MNIGIYNPRVGISESGGTEATLRTVIPHLSDKHEITVYHGEGELLDEFTELDVELRPIPFCAKEHRTNKLITKRTPVLSAEIESISMYINARRTNQFAHMESNLDVISTYYYLDNLFVSKSVSTPSIFRFPGIKNKSIRWELMSRFASTECYAANSESTARRAEEWFNIKPQGIVYSGINLSQFSPDVAPAFTEDRFVVLFVGRLDPGKGVADLIDAHAKLPENIALYIIGDGTLRQQFVQQVEKLGTEHRVQFLGAVPHDEIQHYYASSDTFCLPSYHEGLGRVNIEAMACEVPVISTRLDAIQEYIVDGESGLLIEPGNTDELAQAIKRMYDSPELRERFSMKSRKIAKQFAWPAQANRLEQLFLNMRK